MADSNMGALTPSNEKDRKPDAEPWNVDVKAEAIEAIDRAHYALAHAVECAEEMQDGQIQNHLERLRGELADLTATIEARAAIERSYGKSAEHVVVERRLTVFSPGKEADHG